MANSDHIDGSGGPVPEPARHNVPKRIEGEESMGRSPKPFIVLGLVFMFACLGIMFAAIFLTSGCPPRYELALDKLEQKQVGDIRTALDGMLVDLDVRAELSHPEVRDLAGRDFYGAVLRRKMVEDSLIPKLVSLKSPTDRKAGMEWLYEDEEFPHDACSYSGPRAGELADVLGRSGSDRCVVLTFNARNWRNYSEDGVIVLWSDGEIGEWFSFDEAEKDWGITEDEWADPAGKLFGKKAPFQFTYE